MKVASLGLALAFFANIRLSWKGLPWTNTLAYYRHLYIVAVKNFYNMGPVANFIKLFCSIIYTAMGILPQVLNLVMLIGVLITPKKSFMKLTPVANVIQLFCP